MPLKTTKSILSRIVFTSRWLQAPLYLGLVVAQGVYVVRFLSEIWHMINHTFDWSEPQVMLVVLGLIDVVMISNLLIMVIIGGYEIFVSKLNLKGHPDEPEWLYHLGSGTLKVKLAMALIGISSIHLLKSFIDAAQMTHHTLMWQVFIHLTLLASVLAITFVDKMSQGKAKAGL